VSLDHYRRESAKVFAKFVESVPPAQVGLYPHSHVSHAWLKLISEKASIDEVFLDLSLLARDKLVERFPFLKDVPADANTPLPPPPDFSWPAALGQHVIPVHEGAPPNAETETGHADDDDDADEPATWHDWALRMGAEIVDAARARIVADDVGRARAQQGAREARRVVPQAREPDRAPQPRDPGLPLRTPVPEGARSCRARRAPC
jgi:DNA polymerase eta